MLLYAILCQPNVRTCSSVVLVLLCRVLMTPCDWNHALIWSYLTTTRLLSGRLCFSQPTEFIVTDSSILFRQGSQ